MILTIENLGVIKSAKVDLNKKMVLFCGRNNTGKTYESYIIHAFLVDQGIAHLPCMDEIANQLLHDGSFILTKRFIDEWIEARCHIVKAQMPSIFGISDETSKKLFKNFSISVDFSEEEFQKAILKPMDVSIGTPGSVWHVTKKEADSIVTIESSEEQSKWLRRNTFRYEKLISEILKYFVLSNHEARMLTVERNSIYTFKTELSISRNEMIDRIQQASKSDLDILDIINSSSRRYPLAVRNSLRIANDLENVQKYESPYAEVARMLEEDLLHGDVCMTKNGDVEFHSRNMNKTGRIPFHLSSSIVKTMASLVIYLKHIAKRGDTLIVDEPEMNFHPDVQVVLAHIFAILVNRGLQIVMSTHSDYILREINNQIMASSLKKNGQDSIVHEMGYDKEMLIDYNDISAIGFVTKKKYVMAEVLPIDEYGVSIASIDKTIEEQNQRAMELYDALKYGEGNDD